MEGNIGTQIFKILNIMANRRITTNIEKRSREGSSLTKQHFFFCCNFRKSINTYLECLNQEEEI